MRLLIVDCAELSYRPYPADGQSKTTLHAVLVVFVCSELGDKARFGRDAIRRIVQLNNRWRQRQTIVLYPFAHLSKQLAAADVALAVMDEMAEQLSLKGFQIIRVPFGVDKDTSLNWQAPGAVSWAEFS